MALLESPVFSSFRAMSTRRKRILGAAPIAHVHQGVGGGILPLYIWSRLFAIIESRQEIHKTKVQSPDTKGKGPKIKNQETRTKESPTGDLEINEMQDLEINSKQTGFLILKNPCPKRREKRRRDTKTIRTAESDQRRTQTRNTRHERGRKHDMTMNRDTEHSQNARQESRQYHR